MRNPALKKINKHSQVLAMLAQLSSPELRVLCSQEIKARARVMWDVAANEAYAVGGKNEREYILYQVKLNYS